MKTIYVTGNQWQNHALRGELDCAAGDTGRIAGPCVRGRGVSAGESKVVDLAAWKAENLAVLDGPEAGGRRVSGLGQYEGRELVRRRHRRSTAAQNRAELAATLAVAAALAALIARVLLF